MTRKWDEKFSAAGYDESWSIGEVVDAGSSLDEDADPADVSSPSGWGTKCLKAVTANIGDSARVGHSVGGAADWVYWRLEFVVTAESLANGETMQLFFAENSGATINAISLSVDQDAGALRAVFGVDEDGTETFYTSAIVLDTRYRFECKYDIANNAWEWRMDGVTKNSGSLSSTHSTDFGTIAIGILAVDNIATGYFDLFAVDDADWIGAESSAVTSFDPGMLVGGL